MTDTPNYLKVQAVSEAISEILYKDCTPAESMEALCTSMVSIFINAPHKIEFPEFVGKVKESLDEIYSLNQNPTGKLQS